MTAGRLKKLYPFLKDEKQFFFTYGDGLSDINFNKLNEFHKKHRKIATMTAIKTPGRYGAISMMQCGKVKSFEEKPPGDGGYINGGFFVLSNTILKN